MIEETLRGSMQDLFAAHERQAHGYTLSWSGELLQPPARAVRLLEARFKPYGYTPFLKRDKAGTWVRAVPLAVVAERSRVWISRRALRAHALVDPRRRGASSRPDRFRS
jgi:hypothetical protein